MRVSEKQIKKVIKLRHFTQNNSVFREFRKDTNYILDRAFEIDSKITKIPKFVKNQEDLKKTF